MDYVDRLRTQYQQFLEAELFEKFEIMTTLAKELRRQILDDHKQDCEALLIRMIRDLQQILTPELYTQHKATLERSDVTPDTGWLTGVEISTDPSVPFLDRLKHYCLHNRFFYNLTTEGEDEGIQMLTAKFEEKFSSVARQLCAAHRSRHDEDRGLITIYADEVTPADIDKP